MHTILRQLSLVHNQQFVIFTLLGFHAACTLVVNDVSGQSVGYVFKDQRVFLDWLTFHMGPTGCP